MYRNFFKRFIDIVLALLGLLLALPIFIVVGIATVIESGLPIIYSTERVSRFGKIFHMAKFRSMYHEFSTGGKYNGIKDEDYLSNILKDPVRTEFFLKYRKIPNDPRVTRVGRLIRKTSVDELPQLWNVLKGEMSLVGPRAYRDYEVADKSTDGEYKKLFEEILTVRPGITGPWQTSGRSNIPFEDRIRLEARYAENLSFIYDLSLILKTPFKVIQREGAA